MPSNALEHNCIIFLCAPIFLAGPMFTDLHASYARKSQCILVAWGRAIGAGCAGSRARSVWASMCARSALVSAVADGVHIDVDGQQTLAAVALDGDASECGGVQHGGVRAGQRVARCAADLSSASGSP